MQVRRMRGRNAEGKINERDSGWGGGAMAKDLDQIRILESRLKANMKTDQDRHRMFANFE
jgi:hypothetical protein